MSIGPLPAKAKAFVHARSGGICEGCEKAEATEIHHRKFKSRGGTHDVWNLLHLCGWGNHTGCHGVAHSLEGDLRGWSVNSWADPLTTGFEAPDGTMHWLTPWGRQDTEEIPF